MHDGFVFRLFRNTTECTRAIKPFKCVYELVNDERFSWLEDLLNYFHKWKDSTVSRVGNFSEKDRCKMFISDPTYEGIQISIYSLKECITYLLNNGVRYILTERFCQDNLENYFGKQ